MATEDFQERTEEATPKRRQEFARRGQIARSRELSAFLIMLAGSLALLGLGSYLADHLLRALRAAFIIDAERLAGERAIGAALGDAIAEIFILLWPPLVLLVVVAALGSVAIGGWNFAAESIAWKIERINPIRGIRRLFSLRALMELTKALLKVGVVGAVAALLLLAERDTMIGFGHRPLESAIVEAWRFLGESLLWLVIPMGLIALIDTPFQLFEHARNLRMTRQELRDELKTTDGRPEVKGKIRRLQQELATRRMMDAVPQADVVINNPSHFSVALRYDEATMGAPRVVAKGADLVAARIRVVAEQARVPQIDWPLLARALYFNCDLDAEIPVELYVAVAKVMAYVLEIKRSDRRRADPLRWSDADVPAALRTA